MKQNLQTVLRMTGDVLSDPKRRCVGTLAKDEQGVPVNPTDPLSCSWCLTGALQKSLHEVKVMDPAEQCEAYNTVKDVLGLHENVAVSVFWDSNEGLHDLIANKLSNV